MYVFRGGGGRGGEVVGGIMRGGGGVTREGESCKQCISLLSDSPWRFSCPASVSTGAQATRGCATRLVQVTR